MPKLKPNENEIKNRIIQGCIEKNMILYGLNNESMAAKIHCTVQTFRYKKKRPEKFTVKEFWKICSILKFTDEEKTQIL